MAIETAKRPLFTARYSLPLGSQWTYPVNVTFVGGTCIYGPTYATCSVPPPVSNSSTTIEDYVTFDLSIPNGTAIKIWYTGPRGNMTFDCGSGAMYSFCHLEPIPPGVMVGPFRFYFLVPTPGNYSFHALSEQCTYTSNCSTNNAIGTVTAGLSTIQYDRPYWAWGLATEIGAITGIITTVMVAGIIAYRGQKQRRADHPPQQGPPR